MLNRAVRAQPLHVQSAVHYGVSDARTLAAERTCISGHLIRYGSCTTPVMDGLVDAGGLQLRI